jgi:hypothetical protein
MRLLFRPSFITVFCLITFPPLPIVGDNPRLYELLFWPGRNAKHDKRVVRIEDHPCGTVAVARVSTMPSFKKGQALEPERVVEFAKGAKVLRRWAIPVDSTPIGISGDRLMVRFGEHRLWITADGAIASAESQLVPASPEPAKCETLHEFGESAYVQCLRFRDLETGKYRFLSFEGVCT